MRANDPTPCKVSPTGSPEACVCELPAYALSCCFSASAPPASITWNVLERQILSPTLGLMDQKLWAWILSSVLPQALQGTVMRSKVGEPPGSGQNPLLGPIPRPAKQWAQPAGV